MERDTYWTKDARGAFSDPLGNFFGPRPQLAHGNVPSNPLVMHIHALPDEGKPCRFHRRDRRVPGGGKCLAHDGERRRSRSHHRFQYHRPGQLSTMCAARRWRWTRRGKPTFPPRRSITMTATNRAPMAPRRFRQGGHPAEKWQPLALPSADFSYFDPATKKYVVLPINLPSIAVTGIAGGRSACACRSPIVRGPPPQRVRPPPITMAFLPTGWSSAPCAPT